MFYENNGYKIRRTYGFDGDRDGYVFETIIKINFPGITGFDRKKMFIFSENPKLERFNRDYCYFKKYATTFEALSFFIEILLKYSGRVYIKSSFFTKNFILISKHIKKTDEILITMVIINGIFNRDLIKFKKNIKEEEMLEIIEKLKNVNNKNFQK